MYFNPLKVPKGTGITKSLLLNSDFSPNLIDENESGSFSNSKDFEIGENIKYFYKNKWTNVHITDLNHSINSLTFWLATEQRHVDIILNSQGIQKIKKI